MDLYLQPFYAGMPWRRGPISPEGLRVVQAEFQTIPRGRIAQYLSFAGNALKEEAGLQGRLRRGRLLCTSLFFPGPGAMGGIEENIRGSAAPQKKRFVLVPDKNLVRMQKDLSATVRSLARNFAG